MCVCVCAVHNVYPYFARDLLMLATPPSHPGTRSINHIDMPTQSSAATVPLANHTAAATATLINCFDSPQSTGASSQVGKGSAPQSVLEMFGIMGTCTRVRYILRCLLPHHQIVALISLATPHLSLAAVWTAQSPPLTTPLALFLVLAPPRTKLLHHH